MLRDAIASSGLSIFAEIGLVVFFATFVLVAWRVLARSSGHYDAVSRLPLTDDGDAPAAHSPETQQHSGRRSA